jgi:DMSO/TMAO reductase YedYZ heme-binding membrane subunit
VAWGIVAFWMLLLVEVTSLVRKQLPNRLWARIHLLSFGAYVLATLHYLQAGTERTNPVLLVLVEVVSATVLGLTILRILVPRRATPRRRAAPA